MFILLSGLSGAQTKLTVEDKVAEMLRASGVGITITSLTDLIAFMAGAGSTFIAVRNFCIFTGLQMLIFFKTFFITTKKFLLHAVKNTIIHHSTGAKHLIKGSLSSINMN